MQPIEDVLIEPCVFLSFKQVSLVTIWPLANEIEKFSSILNSESIIREFSKITQHKAAKYLK